MVSHRTFETYYVLNLNLILKYAYIISLLKVLISLVHCLELQYGSRLVPEIFTDWCLTPYRQYSSHSIVEENILSSGRRRKQ